MSALQKVDLSEFALDVAEGLSNKDQKSLPSRYFYDDLGSALFEAITYLPEYGLTRADEALLRRFAGDIVGASGPVRMVAELGSGSGRKTTFLLRAIQGNVVYHPIDVSASALAACEKELSGLAEVESICADWIQGLGNLRRESEGPILLLFLGSSIGNLDRKEITPFLKSVHSMLRPGDHFLLGADLVKDVGQMLVAYDDPVGVTSAFNLNLLGRINRELYANFDLHAFKHQVRWNSVERRIEMHLLSRRDQRVFIGALHGAFNFSAGETIWTESSHKFTELELNGYALASGFNVVKTWIDIEWPFAETLWRVQ